MIGDTPKGAPLRCRLGRHIGQEKGGTMVFTCGRCGGDFWQTEDMSDITALADLMIDAGQPEDAVWFARREIERRTQ